MIKRLAELSNRAIWVWIIAISSAAFLFLTWLIYLKEEPAAHTQAFSFLPAVNASLNAISALSIIIGVIAIKRSYKRLHIGCMLSAFLFSALFLITYVIYHSVHGDTLFMGQGPIRLVYFFVLISHIVLTMVALPFILASFFFALTSKFEMHKSVARWTYPAWLYVSVTGVLIYFLLKWYG